MVPEAGIAFEALPARGYDRSRPLTLLTSTLVILRSTLVEWWRMGRSRPDVVIGFGGYVSIPVGLAAVLRRVPLVLHEQNSVPGLANRILSRWARTVAVTYEESAEYLKRPERATVTGNPVRSEILQASREQSRESWGLDEEDVMLLVFGGSRGARHINEAMLRIHDRLMSREHIRVIHMAGRMEADAVRAGLAEKRGYDASRWNALDYIEDMGAALAASDLVVCRAGATSIAEITARGLPSVLVPYPFATDDHQTRNAMTLVEHGAAALLTDEELDSDRFGDTLTGLLEDSGARATMAAASRSLGSGEATEAVARIARQVAAGPRH